MARKTHKPPSKIKYDKAHPTVSARVTQELYKQLEELKIQSGKSLGDILREALNKQAPSSKAAYERGYNAAKAKYAVVYKCSKCGGMLTLRDEGEKKAAAEYMEEKGWVHLECIKKEQ